MTDSDDDDFLQEMDLAPRCPKEPRNAQKPKQDAFMARILQQAQEARKRAAQQQERTSLATTASLSEDEDVDDQQLHQDYQEQIVQASAVEVADAEEQEKADADDHMRDGCLDHFRPQEAVLQQKLAEATSCKALGPFRKQMQQVGVSFQDTAWVLCGFLPHWVASAGGDLPAGVAAWLFSTAAYHPDQEVSRAAADALSEFLPHTEWRVSYGDVTDVLTAYGAVWLPAARVKSTKGDGQASALDIRTNLSQLLHMLQSCLASGHHTLSPEELIRLVLDLAVLSLDSGVRLGWGSTHAFTRCAELPEALGAALEAIPQAHWDNPVYFSDLTAALVELKAAKPLLDLMASPPMRMAARHRMALSLPRTLRGLRLRRAVCARCLLEVLAGKSYAAKHTQVAATEVGYVQLKAVFDTLLDPKQGLLEHSEDAYTRLLYSVKFAELLADALAADLTAGQQASLRDCAERLSRSLRNHLVSEVQQSKDILSMWRTMWSQPAHRGAQQATIFEAMQTQ